MRTTTLGTVLRSYSIRTLRITAVNTDPCTHKIMQISLLIKDTSLLQQIDVITENHDWKCAENKWPEFMPLTSREHHWKERKRNVKTRGREWPLQNSIWTWQTIPSAQIICDFLPKTCQRSIQSAFQHGMGRGWGDPHRGALGHE